MHVKHTLLALGFALTLSLVGGGKPPVLHPPGASRDPTFGVSG